MPIDVGTFTTQVTVLDGAMPLTPAQVEQLVQLVLRRLEQQQRKNDLRQEEVSIRPQARK